MVATSLLKKVDPFGSDKINTLERVLEKQDSLVAWASLYFQIHVKGAPETTERSKQQDLQKFIDFYKAEVGHDHIDHWTPAISKYFIKYLQNKGSILTGKPYKATTLNRILSTLRHFGRWLHHQRPLLAGDPLKNVKEIKTDPPNWNGLTARQILRLKNACEQRLKLCTKANQDPLMEAAVFYTLLQTGLRESELISLKVHQYHHKGLHEVMRHKSKRISRKVHLPTEARDYLEQYLEKRQPQGDEFLFINRYGQPLAPKAVRRLCSRILNQSMVHITEDEKFRFTPHQLRHTFLKGAADKHGIHFAFEVSGNVSIKEIFHYAKPSQQEIEDKVEAMFG